MTTPKNIQFQKKYVHRETSDVWKKLKYFSKINLNTAIKQPTNERYRMTTPETMNATTGGLYRMSDADLEQEFSAPLANEGGTPRPGMDDEEANAIQHAARQAMWAFSQAAKQSASALKRRRSPTNSRTFYRMVASRQVQCALNELQRRIETNPAIMSQSDFQLLKQSIANYRIRLIVHDSEKYEDLKTLREQTKIDEQAAELATHRAFVDKTCDDETYMNAKDKYLDLKAWGSELAKEIERIKPKNPPHPNLLFTSSPTNSASASANDKKQQLALPADALPGVASQHAQISPATGAHLRNILKPETIRRTFISLSTLTNSIRNDVVEFLMDECRHKDRHEVVKQIKECCIAAAAAASKQKKH